MKVTCQYEKDYGVFDNSVKVNRALHLLHPIRSRPPTKKKSKE